MTGRCSPVSGWWLFVLLSAAVACATTPRRSTDAVKVTSAEDQVGIDDTFDVRVYGESELSGSFRVATDGTIDYPLAGRIEVSGLRTGEIQQLLIAKLKDRY